MLDLQFVCDNLDAVKENCRNRGVSVDVDRVPTLREKRNELIARGDDLRREQKEVSKSTGKASPDDRPALIERGKQLREEVSSIETEQQGVEAEIHDVLSNVPNMTHPDAPVALEEEGSVTVRTFGEPTQFDFEPLDHVALMEKHDLLDLEAGSRVAGHGFYYLKNEAVLLEQALVFHALAKLREKGFVLHTTPDLARDEVLQGIGFIPRGPEAQIYSVENTDLSLVATAEITLGGMLKDQVLQADELPIGVAGLSHCFRTEAGAHGRAGKGIYRVHQFTKVEIFGFTVPDLEVSNAFHQKIVDIEEELFRGLGVPYRVIDTCTGDLGGPAYRKFDLEAWMPGRGDGGSYGEITSASNCTDYQARRLNIRCKSPETKGTRFVHTLNGTAVACTRALIAILENNQRADGTIAIPEVLQPLVGFDCIG